jgi:hypothetical protein
VFAPDPVYDKDNEEALCILFDTENPRQARWLHELRALFQEDSNIEPLNERYFLLKLYAGNAAP